LKVIKEAPITKIANTTWGASQKDQHKMMRPPIYRPAGIPRTGQTSPRNGEEDLKGI